MQSLPLHAAPYLFTLDFGVAALSLPTTMGTAGQPKNEFSYRLPGRGGEISGARTSSLAISVTCEHSQKTKGYCWPTHGVSFYCSNSDLWTGVTRLSFTGCATKSRALLRMGFFYKLLQ